MEQETIHCHEKIISELERECSNNPAYKDRLDKARKILNKIRTKETINTRIDEKGVTSSGYINVTASEYVASRGFILSLCEKHDADPNKLVIGMQGSDMVVHMYDEGASPVWRTLEIIEFK